MKKKSLSDIIPTMTNKDKINWAIVIVAFIFLGIVLALAPKVGATNTQCFCHNVNNNPHTICTSNQGQINGHLGHVNNGNDYAGACIPSPSPTSTPESTSTPEATSTPEVTPSPTPEATPSATPVSTPDPKDPPEKSDPCFYIPCNTPAPVAPLLAETGSNKGAGFLLLAGLGAILFSFGLRKLIK